jgi:hypothetical protein
MMPTTSVRASAALVISEAKVLKQQSQTAIRAMAAGPVSANAVLQLCQRLNSSVVNVLTPATGNAALLASLASDLGLADSAAAAAAINSVITAANAAIAMVVASFPTSGGYILKDQLNADGSVTVRQFSSAQTANLRTALQSIVDSVS